MLVENLPDKIFIGEAICDDEQYLIENIENVKRLKAIRFNYNNYHYLYTISGVRLKFSLIFTTI
jgi:hypothetical protein